MSRWTRRMAIAGGSAVLLGGVAYGGSHAACSARDAAAARLGVPRRLFAAIPMIPVPGLIGQAVVDGEALENGAPLDPGSLLQTLAESPDMRAACALTCDVSRRANLRAAFADEMARGAHVVAARWVIAPSEARIAALWLVSGATDHAKS